MIRLNRFNGSEFWINPHQIEWVEAKPDTTIGLLNGHIYIVKQTPEQILQEIQDYRKNLHFS